MAYGFKLELETLTEEDKALLSIKLSEFLLMVFDHLKKRIKNIDTKYLWSLKPYVVLLLLIAYAVFRIIVLIFYLWCLIHPRHVSKIFKPMSILLLEKNVTY